MVTRIKRLSILQTGKLLAVLYGFLAILFIPFILVIIVASPEPIVALPFVIMAIVYPLMGFIGGIIGAAVYNLASYLVGGLEMTFESVESVE